MEEKNKLPDEVKAFEGIAKTTNTNTNNEIHDSVANFLYFFGIVIIIAMCIIGFCILQSTHIYSILQLESMIAVSCFVLGLFFGLTLIGIGRIIKVVQETKQQTTN